MEEQTGYEELSRISALTSQQSNHSQPASINHRSTSSVVSHGTDLEERAHVVQQGLSVEFIDLQDIDGSTRWLLGIVELLGLDSGRFLQRITES